MLNAKFPTWYHFVESTSHIILTVIVVLLIATILVCAFFIYKNYIKKKYINQIVENFELIYHTPLLFLGRRFTKIKSLNNKSLNNVLEFNDNFKNFFENILFLEMDRFIKLLFKEQINIKDLKDILNDTFIILEENHKIYNQSRHFFYWEKKQREILLEIKNLYNYFNINSKNILENNVINTNIIIKKEKIIKLFNLLEEEMQKGDFIKAHQLISQIWLITKRYYKNYLYLWVSNEIIMYKLPAQMISIGKAAENKKITIDGNKYYKNYENNMKKFYKLVEQEKIESSYMIIQYLLKHNNYWVKLNE